MTRLLSLLFVLAFSLQPLALPAQPIQTLGSLQTALRSDATTGLVDWWVPISGYGKVLNVFGYNNGGQSFLQLFDTASTNGPLLYVSGMNSNAAAEFFTNSVSTETPRMGERIQLTNNFGAPAGLYYVNTTNISGVFRLSTSLSNALRGVVVDLTNNSSAGVLMRVPFHTMAIGSADNFSLIIPDTGWEVGKGLCIGNSTTAGTYTAAGTNLELFTTFTLR